MEVEITFLGISIPPIARNAFTFPLVNVISLLEGVNSALLTLQFFHHLLVDYQATITTMPFYFFPSKFEGVSLPDPIKVPRLCFHFFSSLSL